MRDDGKDLNFSEFLDFSELSPLVGKLRDWIHRYGPLEEADMDDLPGEVEIQTWSEVTLDQDVLLFSGILPHAERIFLSKVALIDPQDSPVTTALFFSCPLCEDSSVDKDEEVKPCTSCSFNRKLFLDLELLLDDCSIASINRHIEPA